MYDIFVISNDDVKLKDTISKLKTRTPLIKKAKTFEEAQRMAITTMFWVVWDNLDIVDDFKFDYVVPSWDREYVHVFKNSTYFDGVCLFPKKTQVSKNELQHRFFINKKEIDTVASIPKPYDIFYIDTYEEYLKALASSRSEMFWIVWNDVDVLDTFKFDYVVPVWDQEYVHVFKNATYFDGLCLFSKNMQVSKKEFQHRFFINKKEIDVVASIPKPYDIFCIDTYEEYLKALENTRSEMFWMIPKEAEVLDTFKFDFYLPYDTFNHNISHVFKHIVRGEETYNGITLLSKNIQLSAKEINFRFIIERKEHDIVASKLKPHDVVFISYNESQAEINYRRLLEKCPLAKRIDGVKGIHNAHIEAAKLAETEMFWVVDGDAIIVDSFNFDYEISRYERDTVHVWQSKNPINDLVYGYGGVKLLPRKETLAVDVFAADMTTSISPNFKAIQEISNITAFDTDEFAVWRSAFRECVKLSSNIINRNDLSESLNRLDIWCTQGADKKYGK